ncbi:MAG: TRAP transporter small permease [Granulosicoccus sp.]|nr:TRAP transporter small permease [Granulosicoccus sp.]
MRNRDAFLARLPARLHWVRQALVVVTSVSLVTLVVIFAWLVFGRYVLNQTPTWVEQAALVLICYITFLGTAAGVYDNTHLSVDFIRESLPAPIRHVMRLAADLTICGFGVVMALAATELFGVGWTTQLPMLGAPESVRTLPMIICGILIALFSGTRFLLRLFDLPDDEMNLKLDSWEE